MRCNQIEKGKVYVGGPYGHTVTINEIMPSLCMPDDRKRDYVNATEFSTDGYNLGTYATTRLAMARWAKSEAEAAKVAPSAG